MWTHYLILFLSVFNGEVDTTEFQVPELHASEPVIDEPRAIEPRVAKARNTNKAPSNKAPSKTQVTSTPSTPRVVYQPTLATATQIAVAPSAADIVKKVQGFYNETKSFNASFHQTVTNQTFSKLKPSISKGKVYILKPGKMRWDYKNNSSRSASDPKVSKSFISDGKYLWAVMHKNKQYYKENLQGSTLPVAVSFLMGTGDLLKEFNVELEPSGKYGSKSDILLMLTPKQPSARYKKLWLVVDSSKFSVKQSVVLNSKGDTNSIRFSSVKIDDGSLKSGHFIFNAKAHKDFRLIKAPQ